MGVIKSKQIQERRELIEQIKTRLVKHEEKKMIVGWLMSNHYVSGAKAYYMINQAEYELTSGN